ncbi:MAG: GNAT family N-acetyltransferase [Candidatus Micrarchaeia archaeon]
MSATMLWLWKKKKMMMSGARIVGDKYQNRTPPPLELAREPGTLEPIIKTPRKRLPVDICNNRVLSLTGDIFNVHSAATPSASERNMHRLQNALSRNETEAFVAFHENSAVGYILLSTNTTFWSEKKELNVPFLAVRPECQEQGVASELIGIAIKAAYTDGFASIRFAAKRKLADAYLRIGTKYLFAGNPHNVSAGNPEEFVIVRANLCKPSASVLRSMQNEIGNLRNPHVLGWGKEILERQLGLTGTE